MGMLFISGTLSLMLTLSMVTYGTARKCDLDAVRQSSNQQSTGGWSKTDVKNELLQSLVRTAVQSVQSSNGNVRLAEAKDVVEAYRQVVAGNNYCILFRAAGNCGDYHCKSYECVAGGHQPLSSDTLSQVEVECNPQDVCDIEEKRKLSEKPMPGGWQDASQDEFVNKLHETASSVAKVTKGSVVEAYRQVVAGFNYCIHFTATAAGNCGSNCKALSCTASGHKPLGSGQGNSEVAIKSVGVSCHPLEARLHSVGSGSLQSKSSAGRQMSTGLLVSVLSALAVIVFGWNLFIHAGASTFSVLCSIHCLDVVVCVP